MICGTICLERSSVHMNSHQKTYVMPAKLVEINEGARDYNQRGCAKLVNDV